jgi:asparagine synthase (glutamine-hydrolysing)
MCGIAGVFHPKNEHQWEQIDSRLAAMTNAISLRGPDAFGHHIEPNVALGHRRLSIIDVASGHQPLFNEDKTISVVFNGEIYNYLELCTELEKLGHQFKTKSDTEVIVHAWEQWGPQCLDRFRGMFAFALWDRNQKTFFLARDRMGVKPVYFGFPKDGSLVFGSEIKALLVYPDIDKTLDPTAVEDYFSFGYVPEPKSIYKSIRKLNSAHYLLWQVGQREPLIKQYWDVKFVESYRGTYEDAQVELRERLEEAVQIRLMSEVPLGAFLSGGVDSSAVVAMMAKTSKEKVKTCSIAFDIPQFDESKFANQVAKQYQTDHQVETVTSEDYGLIDTLVDCYDEPFADSSAIPTYRVCEAARKRVTVALSGDGGDETFAGYRRYKFHLAEEAVRNKLPLGLRQKVFGPLGEMYPKLDAAPRFLRGKSTFQGLAMDGVQAYARAISFVKSEDRGALFGQRLKSAISGYDSIEVFRGHESKAPVDNPLSLIQYLDYKTYLPGDINVKVDRVSMAHSLEVREPLMDHKLVEWAATLPASFKLRSGQGKSVLKSALEPMLSNDILYRDKMGFAVPIASWFRGPLQQPLARALSSIKLADSGYIDPGQAQRYFKEHLSGKKDRSTMLWTILMFSKFLDKNS